jgi:WD40 repeat protein
MMREGAFTGLTQRIDSEQELVTCDASGRVLFWDCDAPEPVLSININGQSVTCVAVSPSGKYFALCRDEMVTVFELNVLATAPPKCIADGWAHSAVVSSVQWSPDERQLVSIGIDSCICVWNFFGSLSSPSDTKA